MEADIRNDTAAENEQNEVFAEVPLFGAEMAGSDVSVECNTCFSCDSNPCVK
ncbi:MAG: hypothetical protein UW81_C0023G0005 [Candidatus Giovannonibacteria bacterium GW2011_GWC2_44_9]|uniref:Uncharacterized protein n=3 Tax=Candidatus Giovannoniibacteriota TaxID=1752738 RepID=A0A0G1L409_9BACT|nr:MAG: hypothetical protein UW49_C0006G0005 [Candidatus Giovannonibacteria bacterium GW2011_GWB1_44_23]KKT63337.1 MAG: hypothetical protein UW57_C0008G0005 [Candidatus Giovannonibacteria bacterium GW2011_GWA1_44_29]KKT83227.1 MAG: hypothetical protein UW81_C0023G0005 [Candidatus Giovannonibacteria bacterium GW2011_GWC2_44_9]KKT91541.1 MAG: hypothetical protein UW93_C0005G0005 [Parcubacteria group bacterium GW2011_GWC1_45_13]